MRSKCRIFPTCDAGKSRLHLSLPEAIVDAVEEPATSQHPLETTMDGKEQVINVFLVDDRQIFRSGLKALLSAVPGITIVGEADDGLRAIESIRASAPDIVLMDLQTSRGDGRQATRVISKMPDAPRVLILTSRKEEESLVDALADGASGFLSTDVSLEELLDAIRVVAFGETYVRPGAASLLAASLRSWPPRRAIGAEARARVAKLSDREQIVLRFVAEGHTGPEISERLGITTKTVDTYRQRISAKLGLRHRSDYVRLALDAALLASADDLAGRPHSNQPHPDCIPSVPVSHL
jgi:DNA-binding NarL/FixJ family response regulator